MPAGRKALIVVAVIAVLAVVGLVGRIVDPAAFKDPAVADSSPAVSETPSPPDSLPVVPPVSVPPSPDGISDGTWRVPSEVKPGLYRSDGPQDGSSCYWARLSGLGGSTDEIVANGTPSGPTTVRVSRGDVGFETRGCLPWTKVG